MMETDRQYNEFLRRYSPRQGAKPQAILSEEVAARQEAYHLKRALRHGGGKFKKQHRG